MHENPAFEKPVWRPVWPSEMNVAVSGHKAEHHGPGDDHDHQHDQDIGPGFELFQPMAFDRVASRISGSGICGHQNLLQSGARDFLGPSLRQASNICVHGVAEGRRGQPQAPALRQGCQKLCAHGGESQRFGRVGLVAGGVGGRTGSAGRLAFCGPLVGSS